MNTTLGFISLLLTSFIVQPLSMALHKPPPIVLITLDGIRWQDVFNGSDPTLSHSPAIPARQLLPNLYARFVDQGIAIGQSSHINVSGPNFVSLPGYLEILRGHPSHDCYINTCLPHPERSILDSYHQWYPTAEVVVAASWDALRWVGQTSPDYHTNIGQYQHLWPEPSPTHTNEWGDERLDIFTMAAVRQYIENLHHSDLMWVALGDADEYAHQGSYADYLQALRTDDAFIGQLVRDLPEDTTFVITTDHGRGANWMAHGGTQPASKRTWLMMRGPSVPHQGMVDLGQDITASAIYPTLQGLIDGEMSDKSVLKLVEQRR